jgi:4-diphosphocytidyl-2-C-methyl-D-erythritol kinase
VTILTAPAKLNLGLRILRRRADGFHDIRSLFLAVSLSDTIHAEPADTTTLDCSDTALPDTDNLVIQADRLFRERFGVSGGARYRLEKRIPVGGGLGGGSSDAAAVFLWLAECHGIPSDDESLHACAEELGSDIPFFLHGGAAIVGGRGEKVEPVPWPFDISFVIVHPGISVSTGQAYGNCTPDDSERPYDRMLDTLRAGTLTKKALFCALANDFEAVVFPAFPVIAEARDMLRDRGARVALMTGSGACVFGIFDDPSAAEACACGISREDFMVFTAHAAGSGV